MKTFILKLEKEGSDISITTFDLDKQDIVKIRGEKKIYLEGLEIEKYWEKITNIKSIFKDEKINVILLSKDKSLFVIADELERIIKNKMRVSLCYKIMDSYVKQVYKISDKYILNSINEIENYLIFKNYDDYRVRIEFRSIGGIDFIHKEVSKDNKDLEGVSDGDLLAAYLEEEYSDYFG